MPIVYAELNISSKSGFEIIDITGKVQDFLDGDSLLNGHVVVFSPHTTMAIAVNETEDGLMNDIHLVLAGLIPKDADYEHNALGENNADAHIKTVLIGQSLTIPVEEGRLALGTWQKVLAVELDGGKERSVKLSFIGEQGDPH